MKPMLHLTLRVVFVQTVYLLSFIIFTLSVANNYSIGRCQFSWDKPVEFWYFSLIEKFHWMPSSLPSTQNLTRLCFTESENDAWGPRWLCVFLPLKNISKSALTITEQWPFIANYGIENQVWKHGPKFWSINPGLHHSWQSIGFGQKH